MGVLVGAILFFVGVITLLAGGIPAVIMLVNGQTSLAALAGTGVAAGIGLLLMAIGALVAVLGFVRGRSRRKLAMEIYERGVATQGTVTFVDKNYSVLINNRPVYSIVEFKFTDTSGMERTSRKDTVDSNLVIRNSIEVGSQVDMKYLADDPTKTILMLPSEQGSAA